MKLLNFGSLNYDHVYRVDHIAEPGETIAARGLSLYCGGKGLNQSVALARGGALVHHAGLVGPDGDMLLEMLQKYGVDTTCVGRVPEPTGNAFIQVDAQGQNSIVVFGGANHQNSAAFVDSVLNGCSAGDILLLQNEVNAMDYLIDRAHEQGLKIYYNPSPFDKAVLGCDLNKVSLFLINEGEGEQITGQREPERILKVLRENYPEAAVVLTLGARGVVYRDKDRELTHGVYDVPVLNTTGAGDTFTGFFIASLMRGEDVTEALRTASVAASIAVSRDGAADSIPSLEEVQAAKFRPRV